MSFISSLVSVIGTGLTDKKPVTAALSELDLITSQERAGTLQAFQYFPETITDSKSPNYSKRNVPGGSHPIMAFLDGGERTISFTAIFTQDENPEDAGLVTSLLSGNFNIGPSALAKAVTGGKGRDKYTVDIAAAIAWLRAYTYPEYLATGAAKPPPICILYLPNSGILGHPNFTDSITAVMTQCDVTYEAFHRNGAPRYVVVNLSFVETVQIGPKWRFVGRNDFPVMLEKSGSKPYTREVIGAEKVRGNQSADTVLGRVGRAFGTR